MSLDSVRPWRQISRRKSREISVGNVKIGGGSGVVKNIADNQIVMGYPATNLKAFLKKTRID